MSHYKITEITLTLPKLFYFKDNLDVVEHFKNKFPNVEVLCYGKDDLNGREINFLTINCKSQFYNHVLKELEKKDLDDICDFLINECIDVVEKRVIETKTDELILDSIKFEYDIDEMAEVHMDASIRIHYYDC